MGAVDRPEFTAWVGARRGSMLRIAWLLTGDRSSAEDLVQSALRRCWPRWSRIGRMADIDAYVRRVMVNQYLSWRGRRWRGEVPVERPPDHGHVPTGTYEDQALLLEALRRLPAGQRAAVVLRFAEDLSEGQTAAVMGCSTGTVKSQTFRGLEALRADPSLAPQEDLT